MTKDEIAKAEALESPEAVAAREQEYDRITYGSYSRLKAAPTTKPDDHIRRYVYRVGHGLQDTCARPCGGLQPVWVGDTAGGDRIRVCAVCGHILYRHPGPHFD